MKKIAGREIQALSFCFILTTKPQNISRLSPKEDNAKIGFIISPANNPVAPKNSKIMIVSPSFSRLNRLNSFFIWGDMK